MRRLVRLEQLHLHTWVTVQDGNSEPKKGFISEIKASNNRRFIDGKPVNSAKVVQVTITFGSSTVVLTEENIGKYYIVRI